MYVAKSQRWLQHLRIKSDHHNFWILLMSTHFYRRLSRRKRQKESSSLSLGCFSVKRRSNPQNLFFAHLSDLLCSISKPGNRAKKTGGAQLTERSECGAAVSEAAAKNSNKRTNQRRRIPYCSKCQNNNKTSLEGCDEERLPQ